jgi:hypothetical protein
MPELLARADAWQRCGAGTMLTVRRGQSPSDRQSIRGNNGRQSIDRSGSLQLPLAFLKRRPVGGRKRPSSAAENQAAGTRINTSLACIGLPLRAPRLGNLHQDANRPIR